MRPGEESIRLSAELYPAASEHQEQRRVEDPFVELLRAKLGDKEGKLRSEDAWEIVDVPRGQRTQFHNERLGQAMREIGWERKKRRFGGPPEWCYVRGDAENQLFLSEEFDDCREEF